MGSLKQLGAVLKRERLKRGWTQDAMAAYSRTLGEDVALVQPTIQRYEAAIVTTAQLDMVVKMCRVLGVPLVDVLREAGFTDDIQREPEPLSDVHEYLAKHPEVLQMLRAAAQSEQTR